MRGVRVPLSKVTYKNLRTELLKQLEALNNGNTPRSRVSDPSVKHEEQILFISPKVRPNNGIMFGLEYLQHIIGTNEEAKIFFL